MSHLSEHPPYALSQGGGEALWFLGTLVTIKAGSEQTGGAFTLLEQTLPPGFATPPHVHRSEQEAFYVLEGRLSVRCGDRTWEAEAGSFILLPRGVLHGFSVLGGAPARLLQITGPAGFEGFARQVSEVAAARTLPPAAPVPDPERLMSAAAAHGIEIVPPPEG